MKEQIITKSAPTPGGAYSQGIKVGNTVYVAGQGPGDAASGQIVGKTIEEQTKKTLENVQAILASAGATLDDVVKTTVHLSDLKNFAAFNKVYGEFFKEPYPVRTTVGSELNGILVEIDVVAYIQ